MEVDYRSVYLRVEYKVGEPLCYAPTYDGWVIIASVGDAEVQPPLSDKYFATRDQALREAIAWVRLRAVHTNPDGSMREEIK